MHEQTTIIEQGQHLRIKQQVPANPRWILFLLSAAAILPFWTVHYPVMADYPNHLARWFVLFHMRDAAYQFTKLYTPAWGPLPYILPDILALGLQYILPIDIVGRIILSLCVILIVYAAYFFLRRACPKNIALASLAILPALNPMFLMGSISYGYSIAFCLLAVGLWVSYCDAPKPVTAVGVVLGLILVYFTHLIGFSVAGLVMGIYALFQSDRWKKVLALGLLSFPALLILVFNPIRPGGTTPFVYTGLTPWVKLKYLFFPVRLYTSTKVDFVLLAGLLVFLLSISKLDFRAQPIWLVVCGGLLLVYLAAPAQYGSVGNYMDVRFLPLLYLFLLATIRFDRVPKYLYLASALLVLFHVASVEQMFISHQRELNTLTASFNAIPRDARVLPLVGLPDNGWMGRGDLHHLEYGVIDRGFLDPVLFHIQGVQPIRLIGSPYCPNVFCEVAHEHEVDWRQVANSYNYLWVYKDPQISRSVSEIADMTFSNDAVAIYRVRPPLP